jgi:hypothetical protein
MPAQLTLPDHGLYVLYTRRGIRLLASIPTPRDETVTGAYFLYRRESVRELFAQLRADPNCIPEDEYLTEDELFRTPDGIAFDVTGGDPEKLHDLLYREPSDTDPGGWLRRPLSANAQARGLTRAGSWRDVE